MTNYLIEYEMYITTELGLSKNTCDNYLKDNEDYLKYLMKYRNVCDPKDISANDIRSYLVTLKRKNLTSSSISRKLSSIKSFHSFLVKFHYSNQNVAKTIVNLSEKCFDESLALYMLAGNLTAYELTKKNYIENFEYLDQYIITYNNNHDYEGIRVLIHRLRGISINIGSRMLYRYATYVDEMLKEDLDIKLVKDELSKIVEINNEIINKLRGE